MEKMKVIRNLSGLKRGKSRVILAAGFFDGVHVGHQKIICKTVARARNVHGQAWGLTFDAHPLKILKPGSEPRLLTSEQHKLELLAGLELDGCLVMPFSSELADVSPIGFLDLLRSNIPCLNEIIVGRNWRFGRSKEGNTAILSRFGKKVGFDVTIIRPVIRQGSPVSSTRIRDKIANGDLKGASILLGRSVSVLGTVVKGRGLGRSLGFPTANIDPYNEVIPPSGVYAVYAEIKDSKVAGKTGRSRFHHGILNIGFRPTFGEPQTVPCIEVHLFDVNTLLYEYDMEIFFLYKIRDEITFPSPAALKKQIKDDVRCMQAVLAEKKERNLFTSSIYPYYSQTRTNKKRKKRESRKRKT